MSLVLLQSRRDRPCSHHWLYLAKEGDVRERSTWLGSCLDGMDRHEGVLDLSELCPSNILDPPYGRLAWLLCGREDTTHLLARELNTPSEFMVLWTALQYFNSPHNLPYLRFYDALALCLNSSTENAAQLAVCYTLYQLQPKWLADTVASKRFQEAFGRWLIQDVLYGENRRSSLPLSCLSSDLRTAQAKQWRAHASLSWLLNEKQVYTICYALHRDFYDTTYAPERWADRVSLVLSLVKGYNFCRPFAGGKEGWAEPMRRFIQLPLPERFQDFCNKDNFFLHEWAHDMQAASMDELRVLAGFHPALNTSIVFMLNGWSRHYEAAALKLLADNAQLSIYLELTRDSKERYLPGMQHAWEIVKSMLLTRKDTTETQLVQGWLTSVRNQRRLNVSSVDMCSCGERAHLGRYRGGVVGHIG